MNYENIECPACNKLELESKDCVECENGLIFIEKEDQFIDCPSCRTMLIVVICQECGANFWEVLDEQAGLTKGGLE